jgi:hypothetical protein
MVSDGFSNEGHALVWPQEFRRETGKAIKEVREKRNMRQRFDADNTLIF